MRHSELEKWKQVENVLFFKIGEITCLPPVERDKLMHGRGRGFSGAVSV